MQHSHNNHYKWGFNDAWFNAPESEGYFQVSIGACSRPHSTFRDECINAARLLGESLTKPILIGLSGGSDSQVVCLSMMQANVPFTPVILKTFSSDGRVYNQFDIDGAHEFCRKYDLTPVEEDLNLDEYYMNGSMQLVHDYCLTNAEIVVQLHLVRKYKDTHAYVNGGGDPILMVKIDEDTKECSLTYSLGPTPIEQYMIDYGIEGCLKFFMYTPELIAAYLDHDVMHYYNKAKESIAPQRSYNYFTFCIKPMMYAHEWPEMIRRQKNTGFEKYVHLDKIRNLIVRMNEHVNPKAKSVCWKYEDILTHLNSNNGATKEWRSIDERDYY